MWETGSWLEARRKFSCLPAAEQKPPFNLSFLCSTAFLKGHFQVVSGSQPFSVYCLINTQWHFCFISKLVVSCELSSSLSVEDVIALAFWAFVILLWWDQAFWFLLTPSHYLCVIFSHPLYIPVLDSLLFDPTNIKKHIVAFLKNCFGGSSVSSVIQTHKNVTISHQTWDNIFSRLFTTFASQPVFILM